MFFSFGQGQSALWRRSGWRMPRTKTVEVEEFDLHLIEDGMAKSGEGAKEGVHAPEEVKLGFLHREFVGNHLSGRIGLMGTQTVSSASGPWKPWQAQGPNGQIQGKVGQDGETPHSSISMCRSWNERNISVDEANKPASSQTFDRRLSRKKADRTCCLAPTFPDPHLTVPQPSAFL